MGESLAQALALALALTPSLMLALVLAASAHPTIHSHLRSASMAEYRIAARLGHSFRLRDELTLYMCSRTVAMGRRLGMAVSRGKEQSRTLANRWFVIPQAAAGTDTQRHTKMHGHTCANIYCA